MIATLLDANHLWVDSRPRALAQDLLEARTLKHLAGRPVVGRALDIGCGRRGTGSRLALTRFDVSAVDALDLHADTVTACRAALADLGDRVQVGVGDARELEASDGRYDAVFSYHLLHHTLRWREAVAEAARVLRPGGLFLSVEMTARFVDNPLLRVVSRHPDDGDRPTAASLAGALGDNGLRPLGTRGLLGCWTAVVAERR